MRLPRLPWASARLRWTDLSIPEIRGSIDALVIRPGEGWTVRGWASDPTRLEDRLLVQIRRGDQVIASGVADEFREDVRAAGVGDGSCGFSFEVTAPTGQDEEGVELTLTSPEGRFRPLGPFRVGTRSIAGACDGMFGTMLAGWTCDLAVPDRPLAIEVWADGERVGHAVADRYRQDLLFVGDGRNGILWPLPSSLLDGVERQLEIRVAHRGFVLRGPPFAGRHGTTKARTLAFWASLAEEALDRLDRSPEELEDLHQVRRVVNLTDYLLDIAPEEPWAWCQAAHIGGREEPFHASLTSKGLVVGSARAPPSGAPETFLIDIVQEDVIAGRALAKRAGTTEIFRFSWCLPDKVEAETTVHFMAANTNREVCAPLTVDQVQVGRMDALSRRRRLAFRRALDETRQTLRSALLGEPDCAAGRHLTLEDILLGR